MTFSPVGRKVGVPLESNLLRKAKLEMMIQNDIKTPSTFNIHHEEFRAGQLEAIEWNLGHNGTNIMAAPTGSGKSAIAKAMGVDGKVYIVCQTKLLQETIYATYGFTVIKGRANYKCAHPSVDKDGTCNDCPFIKDGFRYCLRGCEYPRAKEAALASDAVSLNYSLYLTSGIWREKQPKTLVLDEGQLLSDIVLEHSGLTIYDELRKRLDLPDFPTIYGGNGGFLTTQNNSIDKLRKWLYDAQDSISKAIAVLELRAKASLEAKKALRTAELLYAKLASTNQAIEINEQDWYIKSGMIIPHQGKLVPGIIARPLTAKYHFSKYFSSPRLLIMSATIGNPQVLSEELGIREFNYHNIPSLWAAETRPVYVFKNGPKIGNASKESDYQEQANIIAKIIKEFPTWSGLVHVTRKTEANLLMQRLVQRGLSNRLWVPRNNQGTDEQIQSWNLYKKRTKNAIAITYSWRTGVDLPDERINIVAKTPFPTLGDPFEKARQMYNGKFYLQRTAWELHQALGRTRRGEPKDYDTPTQRNGFVAIVDNNWRRVQKYLDQDITESIVEI